MAQLIDTTVAAPPEPALVCHCKHLYLADAVVFGLSLKSQTSSCRDGLVGASSVVAGGAIRGNAFVRGTR